MNIRRATASDTGLMVKLRLRYIREDYGDISEKLSEEITSNLLSYLDEHLNRDFIAAFAEDNGITVSAAFLAIHDMPANISFPNGRTGTLLNVYTYPEYRRRGISTKVVQYVMNEAKQEGLSAISLMATQDGLELYKKLGFKISDNTPMRIIF